MALAERGERGWVVEVDGLEWPARFRASDLSDAEQSARRLIWGCTGGDGSGVALEVRLPGFVEDRLWLIAQCRRDLEAEMREAVGEMSQIGLSAPDIERVFDIRLRDVAEEDQEQPEGRSCLHGVDGSGAS